MNVSFKVDGLKALNDNIDKAKFGIIRATKRATYLEAEEIMQESLEQVPVETGALKDSAYIGTNADGSVTFGYGGDNTQFNGKTKQTTEEYMVAVHERLDLVHPVGKAKFLEDPINAHKSKLEESLIARIKQFINF